MTSAPVPADRGAFIDELRCRAARAGEATGGFDDHDFAIAGRTVRLRFAGPALIPALTSALAHARVAPVAEPELTVDVWDSESTGVAMPSPPWSNDDYREHGAVRAWFDEDVQAVFQRGSNALSLLEPGRSAGIYWVRAAEGFPFFERAAPLRSLLHLWLAGEGLQLTHAAAIGGPAGCLLLAGRAGAGKSSAALACLDSELGHLADDYCVLEAAQRPVVHALYSSAKAHPDTLDRLRIDAPMVANPVRPPGDKAVIFLHRHRPERLVARAPLHAIVVPAISGAHDTHVVEASPAVALAALAPSTLLQLPGTGAATMGRLVGAVRAVPCHRLEVGTDLSQIPGALASLLAR